MGFSAALEKKSGAAKQEFREPVEAGKIRLFAMEQMSLRYRHYAPFWACFSFKRKPPSDAKNYKTL